MDKDKPFDDFSTITHYLDDLMFLRGIVEDLKEELNFEDSKVNEKKSDKGKLK